MKVAASSGKPSKKVNHILPLVDDEKESSKLNKNNSVAWELHAIPGDNTSPTYKKNVRILEGHESVRQQIQWRNDVRNACTGLGATTLDSRRPIMEACVRTRPLSIFQRTLTLQATNAFNDALAAALETDRTAGDTVASAAVRTQGVDHFRDNAHLDLALQVVLLDLMPAKVMPKVKRQMRREMRKPFDMKVRAYWQELTRMNESELPNLPPFGNNQSLTDDEILDIILHGTPRSWQNEMERQGFDPIDRGIPATVEFMENLEGLEDKSSIEKATTSKPKDKSKSKGKDTEGAKKHKYSHFCSEHGPNYTHDTEGCNVLKNKGKEKSGSGKFSNKTWTRKADESNTKSKKELAAFLAKSIQKQVKEGVKKELAALQKKRKSDDSDDEEGECHLVDILDSDLKGFNYEDMNNLKIDDVSDEVSV